MSVAQRLTISAGFAVALATFWLGPRWLALDGEGMIWWSAVVQLLGPLAAALACWFAARASHGNDRFAWYAFAGGSGLALLANLSYLVLSLAGHPPGFPSVPEGAYFLMAGFFAAGMLRYSQMRQRLSAVELYNFGLIYCGVGLSSLFLLNRSMAASVLSPWGTVVAFLYPVLWFSVAAFGLVSLVLFGHRSKTFAFGLMVLAVIAEATADFRYALTLMSGTYELGGMPQLLWVMSTGLITWAAFEQRAAARRTSAAAPAQPAQNVDRRIAQAAVPAIAVGVIVICGSVAGVVGGPVFVALGMVLAVAFAVIAGLREHWIIHVRGQLRRAVEASREELAMSQKQLAAVLESTSDSVLSVDRDWNVVYFNRNAAATINRSDRLRTGISLWELFPAALTSGEGDAYKTAIATNTPAVFEIFVEDRQVWLGIQAYPTDEGLSVFFRDITDQKQARDAIEHLAHHDPLTDLANRLLFQQRLSRAVASGEDVAAVLIDLDHFKDVNDTLGHPVGDGLLIGTAARLRRCLGDETTIGRLGGDEFAAILVGQEGADEVGMIAQRLIDAMTAPYSVEGQLVHVGVSIGIAMLRSDFESPDELFRNADIALHAAKTESRGSFRFFETAMQIELLQKQALRADLAGALERHEFSLAFQPLVDLKLDRVGGFEALLRWRHPERGQVPPEQFIPVAEETGLIVPIGEWVLRTACATAMTWPEHVSVAVNLSSRQFSGRDLPALVRRVLADTGLAASRLELEITETVLLRDSQANMEMLRELRAGGVRVALDDFGTGFSSLAYLQRFPFSKIKIDRAFITGLPESEESQAIVRSVMGLGQSLGMKVTAEGVETEAQLDWVRTGCDEAQGFYLGRPGPAADIAGVIARLDGPAQASQHPTSRRAG